jgi:hypothetical protein
VRAGTATATATAITETETVTVTVIPTITVHNESREVPEWTLQVHVGLCEGLGAGARGDAHCECLYALFLPSVYMPVHEDGPLPLAASDEYEGLRVTKLFTTILSTYVSPLLRPRSLFVSVSFCVFVFVSVSRSLSAVCVSSVVCECESRSSIIRDSSCRCCETAIR